MKWDKLRALLVIAALITAAAGALHVAPAAAAPAAQSGNLLNNPDMESFASNGVASSWDPWWETIPNPGNGNLDYAAVPTWIQESNHVFVESGSLSQHIGHSWDPWHAGIRQTVSVPPGTRVHFTAYGRVFASTPNFPAPSDTSVQSRMQIGAEPNGSIDWSLGTVQWSGTANPHDTWAQFNLDVTAGGAGQITLFLSANFRGDSRLHLDVWWDNTSATIIGSAANTPVPGNTSAPPTNPPPAATSFKTPTPGADGTIIYTVQPGDTLFRIAGITGVSVAQLRTLNGLTSDILSVGQRLILVKGAASSASATVASTAGANTTPDANSTAAASETPTTSAGQPTATDAGAAETQTAAATTAGTGTVCALLWNDTNGNGVRDAGEGLLAGGQLSVVEISSGRPVQAYTTDGVSEPHCFMNLPAGQYTISAAAPAGYNATTVTSTPLEVVAGSTSTLEFGAQPSAAVANQPAPRPSGQALLTALLFAGGVVFLLLAAGVTAFVFLRRPR